MVYRSMYQQTGLLDEMPWQTGLRWPTDRSTSNQRWVCPGWQLWQITSANGQKMNDNTSFYCVILELTGTEVANTRLSHESQSLPQTSKSLTHAARMCICDPNLDNKDLWQFEEIENNICAIEFHDRTLSSEMSH